MSTFNISDFEENTVEKLLKQYALLIDSLPSQILNELLILEIMLG